MKFRLITLSAIASLVFLTGCNVPLVPFVQTSGNHQNLQIENPSQETEQTNIREQFYSDSKKSLDQIRTQESEKA